MKKERPIDTMWPIVVAVALMAVMFFVAIWPAIVFETETKELCKNNGMIYEHKSIGPDVCLERIDGRVIAHVVHDVDGKPIMEASP